MIVFQQLNHFLLVSFIYLIKKKSFIFVQIAPSPIIDELNDILTEGTEVLHSTESNDIADRKIFIKYILFFTLIYLLL